MWCVPTVNQEFIDRMEEVITVYQKPYNTAEPVVCVDEKSKQLLKDARPAIPPEVGKPLRRDYQYKRNGTRNIFMAVEPKGGRRTVKVTARRAKPDFALFVKELAEDVYPKIKKIHLVCDNLNTHFGKSFTETFPKTDAKKLLKRIKFHYTPKHASWLNMAEIELSILERQCIKGRIPTEKELKSKIAAWEKYRNKLKAGINWKFTVKDARKIFKYTLTKLK